METGFAELFTAVLSSRKFKKFFDGVDFTFPNGEKITLKVAYHRKGTRLAGYQFSKFSFITKVVTNQGIEGYGFGEGENELLTFQKSIAEAVERAVYLSLKPHCDLMSSNGWSAHLTKKKAEKAALNELLERDAVLVHWLTETPFHEIDPATFPEWLTTWCENELTKTGEFNRLRVLICHAGHVPTVQTILMNKDGHAFISHGASKSIDTAIYRALSETCRIATAANYDTLATDFDNESSILTPWDHALAYRSERTIPAWVFGKMISYKDGKMLTADKYRNITFSNFAPKFQTFTCGDLFVSGCESNKIQNLFFGRGDFALKNGLINLERLSEVNSVFVLNPLPHCVP